MNVLGMYRYPLYYLNLQIKIVQHIIFTNTHITYLQHKKTL